MNPTMKDGIFKHSAYTPATRTPNCPLFTANYNNANAAGVTVYSYTGWRDGQLSWYDNCYIHAALNPTSTYWFKGPDALRFCNENFTNRFDNFEIGKSKHAIMLNKDGLIMDDGMLLRLGEDEFITYWLNPYCQFAVEHGGYDVEGKDLTGDVFMYQLGGPRSLDIVEAATGEDFHDLPFTGHRPAKVNGHDVRILRIGMAGSLAYEVHGKIEDALDVYDALLKAGEPFGLRKLGRQAYWNTHTENGFPQFSIHFFYAWETVPEFKNYSPRAGSLCLQTGSYSHKLEDRYVNPYELGWGFCVNLKHDFVGRDACERIKNSNHRVMRTLEWNVEDILDIQRSQFEDPEPYFPMDGPEDAPKLDKPWDYRQDQVLVGDKCIGVSSGRDFSWHYRKMISLAIMEPEYAKEGTEVEVLWGDPGTRQKRIRATVARFPYMNEDRNEVVDVKKK